MSFDPFEHPDRLNLGCGFDRRDGYLNVDFQEFHAPDLVADVRDLSMLPSDHYAEVLASDVLEHLPRTETRQALAEWFRVLRTGGVLRLRTSNLRAVAELMDRRPTIADHHLMTQMVFGTQAYPGDTHLTGFTPLTLVDHLARAGFRGIELDPFDCWMLDAVSVKPAEPSSPLGVLFGGGFYGMERDGAHSWRWSDGRGSLTFVNAGDGPAEVQLTANVRSGPGYLDVDGGGAGTRLRLGGMERLVVSLVLEPGPTAVSVRSDCSPIEAPGDDRRLVFSLGDVAVTPTRPG